ncbi:MAG: TldD/PmbA family protein [candidate division KSB1 bacterium]|nr:TldD/PmbA family protein [candidate division KSB1 bacterium]
MSEHKNYTDLVQLAIERCKKLGADAAEAYISDSQSVQISVSNRQVEQVNAVHDVGIGIRILKDQKMVFGASNDLARAAVEALVADLLRKVRYHTADEFHVIPGKESGFLPGDWSSYQELLSYDPKIAEVPIQEKIQRALNIEEAGFNFSPKITGSMFILYSDSTDYIYLANSNGLSGWFPTSGCGGWAYLSAAEGEDHQSGSYGLGKVKYDDFDPVEVGRKAAENAVNMLGAKPIESCEVPLVVSPEVGVSLLAYLVGMLSADQVQKGKSLFAEKLETQVASDIVNLIDDGKLKGGLATNPVDGEGVARQTTPLIVNGVLKNYLYDCYTAKKGKVTSTGNRSRGGYSSQGGIGSTNLYLRPGTVKPGEIFSAINKGFYLKDAIGLHAGIDATSGDFSIPVAGFMIEKGEITFPIRGISIGGNLFDFLKSVDKIADDLTWFQATGCPTFSVANIKIGGMSKG